ncbi:MAG TPA: hypothetical protein VF407_15100, partial [Polyangiaceae bacterium]
LSASSCSSSSSEQTGDTPQPDTTCSDAPRPDKAVTQRTVVETSEDDFKAQCAARNGIFEVQPGCGVSNACRGMSYDSGTKALTEHTCRALNSCAGYSCVVCD